MQDVEYLEEMAHFDRERIPERVVHAKGGGAFGYFEVTHDITKYTKIKAFSAVGKKTDVAVRFSTVGKYIEVSRTTTQRLFFLTGLPTPDYLDSS